MREIMALADRANQYIDGHKPWTLAKQPDRAGEVQAVCTQGLNLFRVLMIYLEPVLPQMAAEARRFLGESQWTWESASKPLLGTLIMPYEPLATRLDVKAVSALIEPAAAQSVAAKPVAPPRALRPPRALPPRWHCGHAEHCDHAARRELARELARERARNRRCARRPAASISIDEFLRVDLRVAKILEATSSRGGQAAQAAPRCG